MYIRKRIRFSIILYFAWKYLIFYAIYSAISVLLVHYLEWDFLSIPFLPLSTIGVAVALYLGFKNNSSYDRFWEARKIWGGVVNSSRTWAMMVLSFVTDRHAKGMVTEKELKAVHKTLIYRHLAWINALRLHLRKQVTWKEEVGPFLEEKEFDGMLATKNKPTQLNIRQGMHLKELIDEGLIEDFRHMEMANVIKEFYNLQGKCERIKNTPLPRQYAYFSTLFVWIFILLLPFGLIGQFEGAAVWLAVPFHILISWIFMTMELVGHYSENPFENFLNDVPMTALCRTIEIDLKEALGEKDLPEPIQPVNDVLL